MTVLGLLVTRRFAPLFWCQFFSAFSDNLVRTMLAMMILFRVGADRAGPLVTLAVAVFVAPSLVLSVVGGQIADANDKARIARRVKLAEALVLGLVAAGFWFGSIATLFVGLGLLGATSALFSPVKYGILPDHLTTAELTGGNALIEGASFVAILLGLVAGGVTGLHDTPPALVMAELLVVAAFSCVAAWLIPATRPAAPGLRVGRNVVAGTWRLLGALAADRRMRVGALGSAWFWLNGAVTLSLVPLVVKQGVGGGVEVETAISVCFGIGVGLGSLATVLIARGRIVIAHVPYAVTLMAVFLIDLGIATLGLAPKGGEVSLTAFLHSGTGLRIAFDLIGLAAAGGLFSVPLFAAVQSWAGEDRRARVVAGVGVMNALFMVAGSSLTAFLQSPIFGVPEPVLLIGLGAADLGAAVFFHRVLPHDPAREPAALLAERSATG